MPQVFITMFFFCSRIFERPGGGGGVVVIYFVHYSSFMLAALGCRPALVGVTIFSEGEMGGFIGVCRAEIIGSCRITRRCNLRCLLWRQKWGQLGANLRLL